MSNTRYASDIAKQATDSVKTLLLRCAHAEGFVAMVALQKLPGEEDFPVDADFAGAYLELVAEARRTVALITAPKEDD